MTSPNGSNGKSGIWNSTVLVALATVTIPLLASQWLTAHQTQVTTVNAAAAVVAHDSTVNRERITRDSTVNVKRDSVIVQIHYAVNSAKSKLEAQNRALRMLLYRHGIRVPFALIAPDTVRPASLTPLPPP